MQANRLRQARGSPFVTPERSNAPPDSDHNAVPMEAPHPSTSNVHQSPTLFPMPTTAGEVEFRGGIGAEAEAREMLWRSGMQELRAENTLVTKAKHLTFMQDASLHGLSRLTRGCLQAVARLQALGTHRLQRHISKRQQRDSVLNWSRHCATAHDSLRLQADFHRLGAMDMARWRIGVRQARGTLTEAVLRWSLRAARAKAARLEVRPRQLPAVPEPLLLATSVEEPTREWGHGPTLLGDSARFFRYLTTGVAARELMHLHGRMERAAVLTRVWEWRAAAWRDTTRRMGAQLEADQQRWAMAHASTSLQLKTSGAARLVQAFVRVANQRLVRKITEWRLAMARAGAEATIRDRRRDPDPAEESCHLSATDALAMSSELERCKGEVTRWKQEAARLTEHNQGLYQTLTERLGAQLAPEGTEKALQHPLRESSGHPSAAGLTSLRAAVQASRGPWSRVQETGSEIARCLAYLKEEIGILGFCLMMTRRHHHAARLRHCLDTMRHRANEAHLAERLAEAQRANRSEVQSLLQQTQRQLDLVTQQSAAAAGAAAREARLRREERDQEAALREQMLGEEVDANRGLTVALLQAKEEARQLEAEKDELLRAALELRGHCSLLKREIQQEALELARDAASATPDATPEERPQEAAQEAATGEGDDGLAALRVEIQMLREGWVNCKAAIRRRGAEAATQELELRALWDLKLTEEEELRALWQSQLSAHAAGQEREETCEGLQSQVADLKRELGEATRIVRRVQADAEAVIQAKHAWGIRFRTRCLAFLGRSGARRLALGKAFWAMCQGFCDACWAGELQRVGSHWVPMDKATFEAVDANGDGVIDLAEWERAAKEVDLTQGLGMSNG